MTLSDSRKLELIQSVNNENFLRKEVLIPLFRNMGKFVQVLDNHGPNEKGTDIVLVEDANFGGYRYTSVILKAVPINNSTTSAKDRETAANVISQIQLAISSGYHCNIQGRKVQFQSILVVTNQTISNTARESLLDGRLFMLNDIRTLQGDNLLELIDKHLPNFYYYQSGSHARVAEALQAKCTQLSDMQNLPQFSVEERALIDVFVKPQLQHLESRRVEGSKKNKMINKTPDEIYTKSDRVLIIGDAGSGKSIILREAVLTLLAENTRDQKPNLPIMVKAHELAKSTQSSFVDAINEVTRRFYNLADFDFNLASQDANISLLIDGLDEIVDLAQRETLKSKITDFGNINKEIKIILTSRRTQDLNDLGKMTDYDRWEILPFNFGQVREFLSKWFSNREESSNRLLAALEDHQLLAKLPNTPLVLTLLAILFDSDDYREIPANLAELYTMFLDLLLGKWNLDRRVETMYTANIREYLAMLIAVDMHHNEVISISRDRFISIIRTAEIQRGIPLDVDVLLNDFTEQTALLVFNDKDDLEFRHLSFQEFLVALSIYKHSEKDEVDFLVQRFEESWWVKVLYFYCGLKQDTPDILTSIVSKLSGLETPQRVTGVFELGYLIQAAYLTPITIRINSVEAALRTFYECLISIQEVSINETKLPEGIVYFAFVSWLSMQYASRMLHPFYKELFDELKSESKITNESSFVLLALAFFMAQNNDFAALAEVRKIVKKDPKQLLTVGFAGNMFLDNISSSDKKAADVKQLKASVNEVKKWFRSHPDISKQLLGNGKPSLNE
jgi:hypothetical protein